MKLSIKKFAKIKEANIEVDGVTVIAGENNTGKSTVGKILFSLYNAISNIEGKIQMQRKEEIQDMCQIILLNCLSSHYMENGVEIYLELIQKKKLVDGIFECIQKEGIFG